MNNQITSNKLIKTASALTRAAAGGAALVALCLAAPAPAAAPPVPGHSTAFGKTLAQWQEVWFRWSAGVLELPTDANGNAVAGKVALIPIPSTPGDGTPGSLDVALSADQPFVLPLFFLFGNSYRDGSPNDALVSTADFQNLNFKLTLDGVTIMNGANAIRYYSQTVFAPSIPITDLSSPFSAYIWIQGISMVHAPLSPGKPHHHAG